jgi:hypothetical protein
MNFRKLPELLFAVQLRRRRCTRRHRRNPARCRGIQPGCTRNSDLHQGSSVAPAGGRRFVIRATHERGVGVPPSRSVATTTREATLMLRGAARPGTFSAAVDCSRWPDPSCQASEAGTRCPNVSQPGETPRPTDLRNRSHTGGTDFGTEAVGPIQVGRVSLSPLVIRLGVSSSSRPVRCQGATLRGVRRHRPCVHRAERRDVWTPRGRSLRRR